ncbi:cytochrome b [Halomonas vilamensis]|uniref:Cytochrome b n=1 Tax=Vreelandella vilamensis TaxID=531309 RepID=A0ABU1H0M7_9GAMM|nr:cytochrome b [Halomonas vilamensis]MDR5897859.1 cytochrome b [Halomonas vilamensis]
MTDNIDRYGRVSRAIHWFMALLILWQFLSSGVHFFLGDTVIDEFFWATHKPLGLLLFVLIFIRIAWTVATLSQRPKSINIAAEAGHIGLYGFLVIVPGLALVRQYGSGKPFEPFGIPLFSGFEGEKIGWMVTPGNLLHSWLGWLLLAMILGHIFMVFWHRKSATHTDILPRMWR